jgi:uncharacterized protein involved in exopolysaccharide biosynthesis
MKERIPSPPDPNSQSTASIEDAPAPRSGIFASSRKSWWVPVLAFVLLMSGAVAYVLRMPPTFVSVAHMWETERLRFPDGTGFVADNQNYLGTQIELLRSAKVAQLALTRLQASSTNSIPLGNDEKPIEVVIKVNQTPKSSILVIQAESSNSDYAQVYLNAVMVEYLEHKKNSRRLVSGDTLASIAEQVQRVERDLKEQQETFADFQRTNNLRILEEEHRLSGSYLVGLKTRLSDLKLESRLVQATAANRAQTNAGAANVSLDLPRMKMEDLQAAIREWEDKIVQSNSKITEADRLKVNLQRAQTLYDRLVILLQNIDISRNIDQERLAILDPASPAKRDYTREKRLLATASFGSLGIGLLLVALAAFYRAMRRNRNATPTRTLP